jgi:small subunit ribosomal protein S5
VKPEFDSKTIQVRRVTRVTSGGRRFAFSVAVVIGDKKGSVGVGLGKAQDTASAIAKATVAAKKVMLRLNLTETKSLPHQNSVKVSSSRIELRPNFGKGLVAGSSARTVLELAGITDVTAKVLSPSRNKLNNARATLKALAKFAK